MNYGDSKKEINDYVKEGKFTFLIGMGGPDGGKDAVVFAKYGVEAFPTNYVLDSKGKIVWRGVGFDEAAIRAALAKLGVK